MEGIKWNGAIGADLEFRARRVESAVYSPKKERLGAISAPVLVSLDVRQSLRPTHLPFRL